MIKYETWILSEENICHVVKKQILFKISLRLTHIFWDTNSVSRKVQSVSAAAAAHASRRLVMQHLYTLSSILSRLLPYARG